MDGRVASHGLLNDATDVDDAGRSVVARGRFPQSQPPAPVFLSNMLVMTRVTVAPWYQAWTTVQ